VSSYEGRLELTWTNKHLRLLAHDDGSYEWVPPSDYRVAEVRLLDDVATVGDIGEDRARDNLLIRGDALNALRSLAGLPEFAREYLGKVKLAYLDPPFNTQQSFLHYDDALEHSVWLTMMRDRLLQIRELLAPDGSVWVHLDDAEQASCRVMMDAPTCSSCRSSRCSSGSRAERVRGGWPRRRRPADPSRRALGRLGDPEPHASGPALVGAEERRVLGEEDVVLDRQVEPAEEEELAQPVLDLVGREEPVRGLDAAVHLHHLQEARRPVAEARGAVIDVQHRRIEAPFQTP
jgi:hypothetical protein